MMCRRQQSFSHKEAQKAQKISRAYLSFLCFFVAEKDFEAKVLYLIPFFASCSRNAADTATSKPFCAPPLRFFCSALM